MTATPATAPVSMQRSRGTGTLAVKLSHGRTRIARLHQAGNAKIRVPKTYGAALEAVLINTAGGITGGDHLQWGAELAPGGHMVLTTQACERSYRSTGDFGRVETNLKVGAGGHLDWLPQETILFAASKLDRRLNVELAEDATLTAIEAVLLGRDAMGEDAADALLRDNWRIRRNGKLIHAEATQLHATAAERQSLSLLNGNRAFASVLHIAETPDRASATGKRIRTMLPADHSIALSVNQSRLVVRAMAQTGLALRRMIVPVLLELTAAGSLPRLWHL